MPDLPAPESTCSCQQQALDVKRAFELFILKLAVVTMIAFLCGTVSGTLTFMANGNGNVAAAVLAGGGAMAATFIALYVLIR
ncbi:hypothetical protein [Lentzea sp. NPDC060358]|uniref:hypothetical protein n=1 Tax=Lentzea sp. NPDC060358 TaxID=3347103 RepID=UPI0036470795